MCRLTSLGQQTTSTLLDDEVTLRFNAKSARAAMRTRSDTIFGGRSIAVGFIALLGLAAVSSAQVIRDSVEVDMGTRSIFYNRIETPVLKPQPTPAPVSPATVEAELTAEELAEWAAWNAKADVYLFLSCTVFDHSVTEVRWWREDGEYVIWSGIDFNHLRGAWGLETDRSRFTLILGIGDESSEETGAVVPKVPAGEYRIVGFPKTGIAPEVTAALDDLHACYMANRESFRLAFEASEAKRLEDEAWQRANPPVPKDTIIHYFPIRSSYNDGGSR